MSSLVAGVFVFGDVIAKESDCDCDVTPFVVFAAAAPFEGFLSGDMSPIAVLVTKDFSLYSSFSL